MLESFPKILRMAMMMKSTWRMSEGGKLWPPCKLQDAEVDKPIQLDLINSDFLPATSTVDKQLTGNNRTGKLYLLCDDLSCSMFIDWCFMMSAQAAAKELTSLGPEKTSFAEPRKQLGFDIRLVVLVQSYFNHAPTQRQCGRTCDVAHFD